MNELQRTEEWIKARLGKATASRIHEAVARTRNGWGASRANYMADLLLERLTGRPAPVYRSQAMERGTAFEADARIAYELEKNVQVVPVGFVDHPRIKMSGASPDGLVGDDGLVEIKCPNTATHIATLLGASIDGDYIKQMNWQMACTGRQWCDWVSYDPRLPLALQLEVRRVQRDVMLITTLQNDIAEFLDELEEALHSLQRLERAKAA